MTPSMVRLLLRLLNMPRNIFGLSLFEVTLCAWAFFLYLLYRQRF